MCPTAYHHNGFVETHALGHMMYGYTLLVTKVVVITGRVHCFHDCIWITLILLLWDLSTLCVVDHLWPLIYKYIYIYIYIYSRSCFVLWELISTAQIKRRSSRSRVLKFLLELWLLHIACGYPYWSTECSECSVSPMQTKAVLK